MTQRQDQMRALIAAQALEWFGLHRAGELSAIQRQQFVAWLCESPAHAREYLAVAALVQDLQRVAARIATSSDVLIEQARAETEVVRPLFPEVAIPESVTLEPPRRPRARLWASFAAIAAAVTALLSGGWWLYERDVYSTAHAEQRSWRMPDGSTVHLNSSSKIRVRFDNSKRRIELVRGQALFQVAKDAQRPFWVYAGDTAVKAVGTQFDVYRQPRRTLISVVEGKVAVWQFADKLSRQSRQRIEADANAGMLRLIAQLDAGQQATVSGDSAFVSTTAQSVRKTVAWLQRQVVFDHDPLGSAVEEFNRYAGRRIRIDDPAVRATEISGIFSAYDADGFVRFLERQPDMRVERGGEEIIVSSAGSPAR